MDDITATILAAIDFGPAFTLAITVGLGLVGLAVLGFIFSQALNGLTGDSRDRDRDDEDDDR
jgi:hypothetical protein